MTANKLTSNSAVSLTLVEGNGNTDDSLDTNGFALAPASGKIPVTLTLANAPAAGGIVINNSGTIAATAARVIDVGTGANASVTATGAKVTLNNSGTITATGAGKGDLFRVNFDMPQGTVIVNNTGTMKTTVNSNDSQGVRLGKVYSASQITITMVRRPLPRRQTRMRLSRPTMPMRSAPAVSTRPTATRLSAAASS